MDSGKDITFKDLIDNNQSLIKLKKELLSNVKMSTTGMTNFVVNFEDPDLVNQFLKSCYSDYELFRDSCEIDTVELQLDRIGEGLAIKHLDQLIYGKYKYKDEKDEKKFFEENNFEVDPNTGKRKREQNGFVYRNDYTGFDRTLILSNIDMCKDFCPRTIGEMIHGVQIFDNFRKQTLRQKYKLILVSNVKLQLPFEIRTVEMCKVDCDTATFILESFISAYTKAGYKINFSDEHKIQITRKIIGLTYTQACDALSISISNSKHDNGINSNLILKTLRTRINNLFIKNGFGLSQLTAKPWEDYIYPENSNFTYDVKKILRDIQEIQRLKLLSPNNENSDLLKTIESIQMRMPHVIVLYGNGGVGKSCFPVHLAGLLNFDIWDFNINSVHSKWVGEGSERMRESLNKISNASHVIIRIDEYDRAIGATNSSGGGMHEAHKQVESEFMNWLQNSQEENLFSKNNIFIVMTTNHKENITGPMLRSGRADLVIDIDCFGADSIKEAFKSSVRRIKNRGVYILGFDSDQHLQDEINKLDLDKMSEIASTNGFTIRDIDMFIIEMASHHYYYKNNNNGIEWTEENLIKVLEISKGSIINNTTSELILGDRFLNSNVKNKDLQRIERYPSTIFTE